MCQGIDCWLCMLIGKVFHSFPVRAAPYSQFLAVDLWQLQALIYTIITIDDFFLEIFCVSIFLFFFVPIFHYLHISLHKFLTLWSLLFYFSFSISYSSIVRVNLFESYFVVYYSKWIFFPKLLSIILCCNFRGVFSFFSFHFTDLIAQNC